MADLEIELPDGTILVAPEGSDPSVVAKKYIRNRRMAPIRASAARAMEARPIAASPVMDRQAALTGRIAAEGTVDIASPFANALASAANLGLSGIEAIKTGSMAPLGEWARGAPAQSGGMRFPEQSGAFSQALTQAGVPAPATGAEQAANIGGRFVTAAGLGGAPLTRAVSSRLGFTPPTAQAPARPPTATREAQVLEQAGVKLDAAQRSGSPTMLRLREGLEDNPLTAGRQATFLQQQLHDYTRAVLQRVGSDADEATRPVMAAAKARIGKVFNDAAMKNGAIFDDTLNTNIQDIMQRASRNLDEGELKILTNNLEDLLGHVDDAGRIDGHWFNRIRSSLSGLSRRKNVGVFARDLEQALFGSLTRASPKEAGALRKAITQWRTLQNVAPAINKGAEKTISPQRLSNVLTTRANQSMSVFGQGGDQELVELAEAGRTLLSRALPQSGTLPRQLLKAPIRTLVAGAYDLPMQARMLGQPAAATYPSVIGRNVLAPGAGVLLQDALKK